jgi:hypothetical protein
MPLVERWAGAHCRSGGPLGGSRGTARRPRGGVEANHTEPPPRRVCDGARSEGVVPHGPCPGNVATALRELRVSCVYGRGGKSRSDVGYELPLPE